MKMKTKTVGIDDPNKAPNDHSYWLATYKKWFNRNKIRHTPTMSEDERKVRRKETRKRYYNKVECGKQAALFNQSKEIKRELGFVKQ